MGLPDILSEEYLEEWVQDTYLDYSVKGIEVGDPTYEWENAHHPTPKCLKGERTVLLLRKDHAVHGVLQSEIFQHPCVYGWESDYLEGELYDICKKWHNVKSTMAGKEAFKSTISKNPNHMRDIRSLQPPTQAKDASLKAHQKHPTLASENGKRTGPENIKKCLNSSGCKENRSIQGSRMGKTNMGKVARQKWQCLVSGRVANAGNLTKIQKSLGIDTKLRKRIDG